MPIWCAFCLCVTCWWSYLNPRQVLSALLPGFLSTFRSCASFWAGASCTTCATSTPGASSTPNTLSISCVIMVVNVSRVVFHTGFVTWRSIERRVSLLIFRRGLIRWRIWFVGKVCSWNMIGRWTRGLPVSIERMHFYKLKFIVSRCGCWNETKQNMFKYYTKISLNLLFCVE